MVQNEEDVGDRANTPDTMSIQRMWIDELLESKGIIEINIICNDND